VENSYARALTKDERRKLLDGLVNRALIEQAAERDKVFVSEAELKAKIEETKASEAKRRGLARDLTDAELQQLLKNANLTWEDFTRQLKYGILIVNYVRAKKKSALDAVKPPTEAEIRDYYESNKKNFFMDDLVRLRQIYLDTRSLSAKEDREAAAKRADDILRELKGGTSFDDLAARYSEDAASKYRGGEVGWLSRDDTSRQQYLGKTFFDAVFKLKPGETSGVITSTIGLHIVRVEETIPAQLVGFEDKIPPQMTTTVKEFIRAQLAAAKQEQAAYTALEEILAGLRKEAEIKVFEDALVW
jgi:parvulin-like peptidyl-prolyl isomerase